MARYIPAGLIPVPLVGDAQSFALPGKSGLVILSDRPIGAECPAHLLDDPITPAERLFVRNNGLPPSAVRSEADDWTVEISGEACISPRTFSLRELQTEFRGTYLPIATRVRGQRAKQILSACTGHAMDHRGDRLPPVDGRTRPRHAGALRNRR